VNPAMIFETLCCSPEPEAAAAKLPDASLAALLRHLDAGGIRTGIPLMVRGLAENEIIRRWVEDHAPQGGAVGEGDL
jgi:hypothetical protein